MVQRMLAAIACAACSTPGGSAATAKTAATATTAATARAGTPAGVVAARVIRRAQAADNDGQTIVWIDLGNGVVDHGWVFAIVDDGGNAVTEWMTPEAVTSTYTIVRFDIGPEAVFPDETRVTAKQGPR